MCRGRGGREGEGQKRVRRELREKGRREGKRRACEKGKEEKHGINKGKDKEGGRESEDGSGGEERRESVRKNLRDSQERVGERINM